VQHPAQRTRQSVWQEDEAWADEPAPQVDQQPLGRRGSRGRRNAADNGRTPPPATPQAQAPQGVQDARRALKKRRRGSKLGGFMRLLGLLLLAAVLAAGAFYVSLQIRMTDPDVPALLTDHRRPLPTEPFTLAIFGCDSRDPNKSARADTVILARIDPVQNKMWMVSIPRDTRVEIPGQGTRKINAAYAFGGPDMAIQALKDVTGQQIDYFITINFWGFRDIVDAMGGIEIDVPIAINDPQGDITPDKSASVIEPGLQTLDGAHALTFVRHRDGYADRDFGRMRAQQAFFRAIGSQLTHTPVWRLPFVANAFADNTRTNFRPFELALMARAMRSVGADDTYMTTLPGTWKSPYVWIDEDAAAVIWQQFGTTPFE